jgi:hypothetical protein
LSGQEERKRIVTHRPESRVDSVREKRFRYQLKGHIDKDRG